MALETEQNLRVKRILTEDTRGPSLCADVLTCYTTNWSASIMPDDALRRMGAAYSQNSFSTMFARAINGPGTRTTEIRHRQL